MRTILITGPGGSGRTTVAAATALAASRRGTRTLLLGADRDDTLGAALGVRTGPQPVTVEPGLTARRPDPAQGFRDGLAALQDRAASALDLLGASRLDPEELTPLPGADELALLRALRDAALAEEHDLLVVDLPPAPRALALLALPEELRRYLRRLLPPERQAARALRPVLGRLAGVPMPAEALYESVARWDLELAAAEAVVADRSTVVRLVAEPGPAGADAVRAAALGLALRGLRTDLLVANRVLPEEEVPADSWLAAPSPSSARHWRSGRERTTSAPSPTSDTTRAAPTTSPNSTLPASPRRPPPSNGPSPTGWPTTASSSGTSRCPAPCARTWTWSAAATNWWSPPGRSAGSSRCRPRCAAAPSTAPRCGRAPSPSGSRRTLGCGRGDADPAASVRVTS